MSRECACRTPTWPEFGRYLDIAIKAANETERADPLTAADYGAVAPLDSSRVQAETIEIRRMLYAQRKRLATKPPR